MLRSEAYNSIIESDILKNMFLKKDIKIKEIKEDSQLSEVKYLRNFIIYAILKQCINIIETEYKGGELIKSNSDFNKIINNESHIQLFENLLIDGYYKFLKENIKDDDNFDFIFTEVITSFLSKVKLFTRQFSKQLYENSLKYELKSSDFEKNAYFSIVNSCENTLRDTINNVLSNESNIYQYLVFKMNILNLN